MILLAAAAHAAPVTVDYADEADLHFTLGLQRYERRDYTGALEHLLASNRLVPNRNVVFNLARTYEQLGQTDAAWRYYDRYLRIETDPKARVEAEEALNRLTPRVARVRVDSDPPGATVYVERVDLGSRGVTPITLALPPGDHNLLIELDGYLARSQAVELTVGALADLDLALVPRGITAPPTAEVLGGWLSTTVRAHNLVLVSVEPDRCAILPDRVQGVGQYVDPLVPLPRSVGSAIATATPAEGLVVDLVIDPGPGPARTTRSTLEPVSRRSLVLEDAAVLHEALFDRCSPTNAEDLTTGLAGLPEAVRLDAMRLFGEWAAWRGAPDAAIVAEMCADGSCTSLADRLTHP